VGPELRKELGSVPDRGRGQRLADGVENKPTRSDAANRRPRASAQPDAIMQRSPYEAPDTLRRPQAASGFD
jgi:hypothetical protein